MSLKGKIFHVMLKYRHLLKGQLKPEIIDKNTSIEKLRCESDEMAAKLLKKIDRITYRQSEF